ncbi:indolethylamine N-methyltransferase-like [Gastrophryne carolinensis]
MSSSDEKHYHDEMLCDKELCKPNPSAIEENLGFPVRILHDLFYKGKIKAEKALDFSTGSYIYQLISLSNDCKEIYMLRLKDDSIENINQWLKKDGQATDWSYSIQRVCHLEGNKQGWKDKEEQLRNAIKGVYKWRDPKTSDVDPSLVPEVDCVISLFLLNMISRTKKDFQMNLKKVTSRLKVGGKLALFTPLNMTYYQVGDHRYKCLKADESEVQEMVVQSGFVIERSSLTAKGDDQDTGDDSHKYFILARKE